MSEFQFGITGVSNISGDDFVSINKPGEYLHRVLVGGSTVESVFYPTQVFDEQEQALKSVYRVLKRDSVKGSALLDLLTKTDLILRKQNAPEGSKNIKSQFTGSKKWVYLIFDRTNPKLSLKIAQYPFSVAKELNDIQNKLDVDDPSMLRYGPTFVWDAIITHKYDEHKKCLEWQKHSYTVEVNPNSKFNGAFPALILDSAKFPNPISALDDESKKKIFTEEEWEAINDSKISMDDVLKPNTEEEIIEQLTDKFPIDWYATRNDVSIFPHREEMFAELKASGLKMLISDKAPQLKLPPVITGEDEPEEEVKTTVGKISLANVVSNKKETIIKPTEAQKAKINITKVKGEESEKTEDEVDNSFLSNMQKELKKNKEKNEQAEIKKPEVINSTEKITLNIKQ